MNEIEIFKKQLDIIGLENKLKEFPQEIIPTNHEFMGGVYLRTIFIPGGTLLIGKRHRYESCNLLLSGELSVYVGDGIPAKRIKGPFFFRSEPGSKKIGYAHTDVVFINLHPTQETDLEKIEEEFIIPEAEYQLQCRTKKLLNEGDEKCLG